MRINDTIATVVDDVTIHTSMTWREAKGLQAQLQGAEVADNDVAAAMMEDALTRYVRRVEGLEDEQGVPITQLTVDVLQQLPVQWINAAFRALIETHLQVSEDFTRRPAPGAEATP